MSRVIAILIISVTAVAARQIIARGRVPALALWSAGPVMSVLGVVVFGLCLMMTNRCESQTMLPPQMAMKHRAAVNDDSVLFPGPAAAVGQRPAGVDRRLVAAADIPPDPLTLPVELTECNNRILSASSAATLESLLGTEGTVVRHNRSCGVLLELLRFDALPGSRSEALSGFHALVTAMFRLTVPAATVTATVGFPETSGVSIGAPSEMERPSWLEDMTDTRIVVRSEFEETQDQAQAQLAAEIARVLLEEAMSEVDSEASEFLLEQNTFSMGDNAVGASIVDRFSEEVPISLGSGPKRMFRTAALIEFPENLKDQAVRHVKRSVQTRRTWTVTAAAVSLALVVSLAAGLLQLVGSSSIFNRWCGIPLITLLILPGAAISSQLVHQVVTNRDTDFPSPFEFPVTVVETDLEHADH